MNFDQSQTAYPERRVTVGDAFVAVPTGPPPVSMDRATALAQRLTAASPADQRTILLELVLTDVTEVLGRDSSELISAQRPLEELGFDSLTALELADQLAVDTGLTLSGTLAFDYPSAAALAEYLWLELIGRPQRERLVDAALAQLDTVATTLAEVSLDDASAARLTERLRRLIDACDQARRRHPGELDTDHQGPASQVETTYRPGTEDLATASADELIDIIRNEFGGGDLPTADRERKARGDVE